MAVEGKNEVARSLLDLQPTAILELYKLFPDTVGSPSKFLSFHGGSVFGNNVIWQGIQYMPIPVEAEGFGVFGDGTLPRPKIKVSNNNNIVTYFLGQYKDFKNAKVFRKKVFVKHLDDVNFDGGNPFGLANSDSEISEEKYLIGQKVQENKAFVEFELNLPLDLDNFDVNHRTVNAKYCYWQYRGLGCRYEGLPIEKEDGEAFTDTSNNIINVNAGEEFYYENLFYQPNSGYSVGETAYIEDKSIILDRGESNQPIFHRTWYVCSQANSGQHPEGNPSFWQKDGCNKKIEACQKRFSSKSLVKSFIGEEAATSDYLNLHRTGAASFATTDANVTGVFGGDSWTLSIFMRGEAQNQDDDGDWYNPAVFATHELPRTSFTFSPAADGTFDDVVRANLHFSDRTSINRHKGHYLDLATPTELGTKSKLTKVETKIASRDKFHCLVFRKNTNSTIDILVNPQKNQYGQAIYSSKSSINIDNDTVGVDLFSLFSDKTSSLDEKICFGGDIGQVCLWSGRLNDDEVCHIGSTNAVSDAEYYLTDNGLQKTARHYCDYTPLRYNEATGYLSTLTGSDRLAFWYDMQTGLSSSNLVIQDESHNNYDITGFGETGLFEKRTIEYTKGKFQEFVPHQNAQFQLPFGGFPGTDGFDYKAQGSQNI
ncbi:phage minor tail protein L [Candidatus Pelagibacter sp.]|nr:phage minor tail protein L [Candidatus Pelagibacter sp.]